MELTILRKRWKWIGYQGQNEVCNISTLLAVHRRSQHWILWETISVLMGPDNSPKHWQWTGWAGSNEGCNICTLVAVHRRSQHWICGAITSVLMGPDNSPKHWKWTRYDSWNYVRRRIAGPRTNSSVNEVQWSVLRSNEVFLRIELTSFYLAVYIGGEESIMNHVKRRFHSW
jgi:hypothetical protein